MENGIKILLVEDNPGDARIVSEMLRECVTLSFRMTHAVRIDEALKILKEEKLDVVLLDLNLPDSLGLDGVEKITAQEPAVPVIIFTSLDDERLGIEAVRKHAGDYLVKGQINANILVRSIRYAIERKREEEQLRTLNRTLRALSSSNKALMEATEESAYLQDICRIIIEECGYTMVWIGYAEEDEAKSVRPVAYAGFEENYLETLRITWADTKHGRGPTGTAIRTGKPTICQNIFTDPRFEPWRKEALKRGYASSISLPLLSGKQTLGALNIYAQQPDCFSEEEKKLLLELASDLASGITLIRLRTDHAQAEATVRRQNIILESINRIFKEALTSQTEEDLGRTCLAVAEELTGSKFGFIGELGPDGLHNIAISDTGWKACTLIAQTGQRNPPGNFKIHGIYGRVLSDGKGLYTNDPASHPDRIALPPGHPPLEAFLGVPLISENRTNGMIAVANRDGGYSQNELAALEALAPTIVEAFKRKRAENALKKAHDALEFRVQERTAELNEVVEALQEEMDEREQAEQALRTASLYTRNLIEASLDPLVTISADGKVMDVNRATVMVTGASPDELIGSDFADYFTEPEKAKEIYKEVFLRGTIRDYPLAIRHTSGFVTDVLYNATIYRNEAGEIQGVFAAARDVTERNETERHTSATNALLSLFAEKPSRKEYLDAVVDLVHSWTGCRCVGIRILGDEGYIPYESYLGFSREFWESENRLSIEHDQCVCIRVVTESPDPQDASVMTPGGSFHCDDTVAFVGRLSPEEKARFRGVCIQNGFLSLNVVPIRYGKKVLGTIHLADEQRKKISLPFIEFLESMSPLIGEAINRFNLKDELRKSESRLRFLSSQLLSVQEDERKRISAELHDDIAAKLATIKFSLEKKLLQPDKAADEANQSLKGIISMVLDTVVSTRRIMINLRPAMIDDLGILATLNWFCREFEQIFDTIHVEKQVNIEETEIPDYLKIVIFRIVQEGMNNIAKHSGANHIALTLEKINDFFMLSIEDNGRGFDVENKNLGSEKFQGFGILNMEERARLTGGDFSITSVKEKGTSIKVTWPLKPIAMDSRLRIEPS